MTNWLKNKSQKENISKQTEILNIIKWNGMWWLMLVILALVKDQKFQVSLDYRGGTKQQ